LTTPAVLNSGAVVTLTVKGVEAAPPSEGLNTVTLACWEVVISEAVIAAVNCVALRYVVGRALPFQRTTESTSNPEPFTVRGKDAPPTATAGGEAEDSDGGSASRRTTVSFDRQA
jgi:hypothetical protein